MMTRDFGMGFFGRRIHGEDMRLKFREEWKKMSDSERLEYINKRMEAMDNEENGKSFCGREEITVEAIDARCLEWIKKTPEEKEEWLQSRKEAMHHRQECMADFRRHRGFGHRFWSEGEKAEEQTPGTSR